MRLAFGLDEPVAQWVAHQIGHQGGFGACRSIAVVDDNGDIAAGVVFHSYNEQYGGIEVSMAATTRRWATRDIIRSILRFPFEQLHCVRVTAVTPRKAASPRRFLEGLGFKREGLIRKGFRADDAVVYGLLQSEWAGSPLHRAGGLSRGEEGRIYSGPAG